MTDIAELGLLVRSDGVVVADKRLQSMEKSAGRVVKASEQMSQRWEKLARDAARLAAIGGAAMSALAARSLRLAIDAEETANKFRVVFRGAVEETNEALLDLTRTIPMTLTEMRGLSAGIQDMLVPMGVARDEASGMSVDLVRLAGDLGSFNNVNTVEVLEAMKSALAGSSEPMRRFGVDTRVTRLEQIALRDGLIRAGQEMDNAAMAQATLTAIMEDSSDAIGDAERTVNSTANQLKFMARNARQAQEDLGQALLPAFNQLLTALNDNSNGMSTLEAASKGVSITILNIAAGIAMLSSGFATLGKRIAQVAAIANEFTEGVDFEAMDFVNPLQGINKLGQAMKNASDDSEGLSERIQQINEDFNADISSTQDNIFGVVDEFLRAADAVRNAVVDRSLGEDPTLTVGGDTEPTESAIQTNIEYQQSLEGIRAELEGPLAVAQLEHNRAIDEAQALYDDGKITLDQLRQAQRLYNQVLNRTKADLDGTAERQRDWAIAMRQAKGEIDDITQSLQREITALQGGEEAVRELQRALAVEQAVPLLDPEIAAQFKGELETIRELAGQVWDQLEEGRAQRAILELTASFSPLADEMLRLGDIIQGIDADLNAGLITDAQAGMAKIGAVSNAAFSAMMSGVDQASSAYQKLEQAQKIVNVALGVAAILQQGMGDPYTAIPRMLAMAAMVASLGVRTNTLSGGGAQAAQAVQGTGTVLGDSGAQSESIANAVEITADATSELVGINRGMLRALTDLEAGISGASGLLAGGAGAVDISGVSVDSSFLQGIMDPVTGFFDDIIGGFLGANSTEVVNQGIQLIGGLISDMTEGAVAQAFAVVESSSLWGLISDTETATSDLDEALNSQINLIFQSMIDTVTAAGEALGIPFDELQARIDQFEVEAAQISLEGLSADEQQAAIQAVFSKIFDDLASEVIPFIGQFQQVGEGMGETLVRVATSVQVAEEAIKRLGLNVEQGLGPERMAQVSVGLVEAAGGIESFISQMQGFVSKFAPEAHQFEVAQADITSALDQMGIALPETREGFWQLLQTIDATTEAGQQQIATLLGLQDAADAYYSGLEDVENERLSLEQRMLQVKGDTNALRVLELNQLDASNRALQERLWALEEEAAIASERQGLQQRLLQLQGNTTALRQIELQGINVANQALQQRIWALEDEAAVTSERNGLQQQWLQLTGNVAAQRQIELQALDESNRALQQRIWALEDEQALADILDSADTSFLQAVAPAVASFRQLRDSFADMEQQATDLGATESELMRIRQAANAQLNRWINETSLSTLQMAEDFFSVGQTFSSVSRAVTSSVSNIRDTVLRGLASIDEWLMSSQLSDISPLTPSQRLTEAESQFQSAFAAILGGDLSLLQDMPGLADQFLGEAAAFYGTASSQYNDIWLLVQSMMNELADIEVPADQLPPTAAQVDALIANTSSSGPFSQGIIELQREIDAANIAGNIAALAEAQERTPSDIARELGLSERNMRDLLEALGADVGFATGNALDSQFNDVVGAISEQNPLLSGLTAVSTEVFESSARLESSLWHIGAVLVDILGVLGSNYNPAGGSGGFGGFGGDDGGTPVPIFPIAPGPNNADMSDIRNELSELKSLTMVANADRREGKESMSSLATSAKQRVEIEMRRDVPQGKIMRRKETV